MNEGWIATRLGLRGIPNSAEEVMVARDISLAALTGGRIHLAHVSTAGTVELVRRAKERGVSVTCEATPHHLTLTEENALGRNGTGRFGPLTSEGYNTYAKVNPPLRSQADVDAVVEGLRDGTIDVVATDHAPHNTVDKQCTFAEAAFGISGLETALGSLLSLAHSDKVPLPRLVEALTAAPAKFLGRTDLGTLAKGAAADVVVFAPDTEWTVDARQFVSKGKNTPLDGAKLKGRVVATIYGGLVVYEQAGGGSKTR
jgi:dihydroorotase